MSERFNPDYVIAPGVTLEEWMQENGLPMRVAAHLFRMEVRDLERLIAGKRKLTRPIAVKLGAGTGIPAQFWLNYEHNYRAGLAAGKKDTTEESRSR